MHTSPVILLNIEDTVQVLDGLVLYSLAEGNEGSRKVDDYESCMKFQVMATNTLTGDRTRQKYALHGRLTSRKKVGIDHQFVLGKIVEALEAHLKSKNMIISGDAAPSVFMTRAIWRYIFAAGTRVSNFANGIGIFSQPQETNFIIDEDPIEKLQASEGSFTLAVSNGKLVKFYLGEEFPMWAQDTSGDPEDKLWTPCKKRVTPANVDACLEHFVTYISPENSVLEVFAADKVEDLLDFARRHSTTASASSSNEESDVLQVSGADDQSSVSSEHQGRSLLQRLKGVFSGEEANRE